MHISQHFESTTCFTLLRNGDDVSSALFHIYLYEKSYNERERRLKNHGFSTGSMFCLYTRRRAFAMAGLSQTFTSQNQNTALCMTYNVTGTIGPKNLVGKNFLFKTILSMIRSMPSSLSTFFSPYHVEFLNFNPYSLVKGFTSVASMLIHLTRPIFAWVPQIMVYSES